MSLVFSFNGSSAYRRESSENKNRSVSVFLTRCGHNVTNEREIRTIRRFCWQPSYALYATSPQPWHRQRKARNDVREFYEQPSRTRESQKLERRLRIQCSKGSGIERESADSPTLYTSKLLPLHNFVNAFGRRLGNRESNAEQIFTIFKILAKFYRHFSVYEMVLPCDESHEQYEKHDRTCHDPRICYVSVEFSTF